MGGVTPEYQHLNDYFVPLVNIANELTSWNKSIGCCCWRSVVLRVNIKIRDKYF